jgi:hypothetical protein
VNRPPRAAHALLRACLATAEDPRPEAWRSLGDARAALAIAPVQRAGLLPQLLHAATLAGVELDPPLRSRLRAARVHEDLRAQAVATACRESRRDGEVVLRGVALAHTAYDDPALRHCHDLDLLSRDREGVEVHPSGLPVSRHRSIFGGGHPPVGLDDVVPQTVTTDIAGLTVPVLHPADALVHVCAHAATIAIPGAPLWPLDAAMIVRRDPELDWDRVVARAAEWKFVGAVFQALAWLRRELGVPVPGATLRELRRRRLRRAPRRLLRLGPG